ncbi:FAD binding domain-containing protein [Cercophora scortea]|uniref:FAD binding domain-containing protein n=1 Tax=Cercophora scortea TaxID=314031 RepID=A0AAE0I791_9PEZI|nr:FAD binding domain-containing protein [Cercophora scortea]
MSPVASTDYLVVGAGPAGGSLASFLGQNGETLLGLKGMLVSSASGTADTPRAHLVNPFTVAQCTNYRPECLADIGLEDDARRLAITGKALQAMRWCKSVAGEEYGRALSWGGHPDTAVYTALATPFDWLDLPQSYMEPLLIKYASHHGFDVRFNTELLSTTRQPRDGTILCTLRDVTTHLTYQITTRFLFGADGGRSTVARQFDFTFTKKPSQGIACNVLFNADLSHLMTDVRASQIQIIANPSRRHTGTIALGSGPTLRVVRKWNQWLLSSIVLGSPTSDPFAGLTKSDPDLIASIQEIIGDDSVPVEILRLDPWVIRETVADVYHAHQDGANTAPNVFLLGDAAHRHPPAYGLGSNTCIQDAYNLAWKVAYVARGLAGPSLLGTYNAERQPVGAQLVRESNDAIRKHVDVWAALGLTAPTPEEGQAVIDSLSQDTPQGSAARKTLHEALEAKREEGESLGLTMNQTYTSSATYLSDETGPRPTVEGNPIIRPLISTYPGSRLPHAWLDVTKRRKAVSTQSLAGHGAFVLFTGHGGAAWRAAAEKVGKRTGVPIRVYGIGMGLDYIDVDRRWEITREVEESGCVLVRPDRFVAWRAMGKVEDAEGKLGEVIDAVLSRGELEGVNGV